VLTVNVATGNLTTLSVLTENVITANISSLNVASLSVSNIYSLAPVGNTYLSGNIVVSGNVYSSLGTLGSGGGFYFYLNSGIGAPASYVGGTYGTTYQLYLNPTSGFFRSGASTMISVTSNGNLQFSSSGPYMIQAVFLGTTDTITGMAIGSSSTDVRGTDQSYLYRYTSLVTQNPTEIFQCPLNITDTSKYYYVDLFMLNATGLGPTSSGYGGTYLYVTPLVAGGAGTGGSVIVQPTQWLTSSNINNIYFQNYVGIGTTGNPQYNLDVTGNVHGYSFLTSVTSQSTTYAASVNDTYIGMSNGGTVTLPLGSSVPVGKTYIIKDESGQAASPAYHITVQTSDSNTIDGNSSFIIVVNYVSVTLLWTGSRWSIV